MDLAGLLGFEKEPPLPEIASRELMGLLLERGAAPRAVDGFFCTDRIPAKWFFQFGAIFDKQEAARDFYDFFYAVRKALSWATDSERVTPANRAASFLEPPLVLGTRTESNLYVTREGRLYFCESSPWTSFGHWL